MIVMHDIFCEEGSIILVEVQLVKDSLFGWWSVFFFKHESNFINNNIKSISKSLIEVISINFVLNFHQFHFSMPCRDIIVKSKVLFFQVTKVETVTNLIAL